MQIKTENLFIQRKNQNKDDNSLYAQIIKNERVRRNMTLEEMSENICCVSYLSKLENSLVNASDKYVKALFERVNINYDELKNIVNENTIIEVLNAFFLGKNDKITELYNEVVKTPFSSTKQLVLLIYYLNINSYSSFECEVNNIDNIISTLNENEKIIYLLLLIEYFIKKCHYKEASKLLDNISLFSIDIKENRSNRILYYLIVEAQMKTYYELKDYLRFLEAYNVFKEIDYICYPVDKKIYFRLLYNELISTHMLDKVLDDINTLDISYLPEQKKKDCLYLIYLIRIKKGNLQEIFNEIIENKYYNDVRIFGVMAMISYQSCDSNITYKFLEIAKDYHFEKKDDIHEKFINFILFYKTSFDNIEKINFLKNEILPTMKVQTNYYYDMIYKDVYVTSLASESRYKEAYRFISEFYSEKIL